jgi:prevent-host-death family protein
MDVSVRELRNHTARVISAIEAGEPVVLTKHGRPVADITPRNTRVESKPSEVFLRDLEEIAQTWREAGVRGDPADYDTGYTTDDVFDELD